jgi:group I intron endonuclease
MERRKRQHQLELIRGVHENEYLQRAFVKYGADVFVFENVLECSVENLLMYEQILIDGLCAVSRNVGYNLCPIAGSTTGKEVSEETKARMREARKGMKLSEEHRSNIGKSLMGNKRNCGRKHSEEHKRQISEKLKGRTFSTETIEKMNASREKTRLAKLFTVT